MQNFVEYILGDDMGKASVFLLGLSPWMTAMILARIIGFFMDEKSNKVAPNRMRWITNLLLITFALIQSISKMRNLTLSSYALSHYGKLYASIVVLCQLLAGSLFLVWLVEKNIKFGVGGPSSIILLNIIINIVTIVGKYRVVTLSNIGVFAYFLVAVYIILTVSLIIILSQSEVRIPVYKSSIHNEYASSNYLLFKINPLGTLPSMYIIAIYSMLMNIIRVIYSYEKANHYLAYIVKNGDLEHSLGIIIFMGLFFILSIILTLILIDPKEIADNLLKNGDCIENVRPGKETYRYLRAMVLFLVSFSNIFIMIILVIPLIIGLSFKGMSDLFSLPLTFMVFTSIVLSVKDEIMTRSIGGIYEKRLLDMKGGH
jgi:preprotein translocase subunit SecY